MFRGFLIIFFLSLSIGGIAAVLYYLDERSERHEVRLLGALAFVEVAIEASQGPNTELYSPSIERHIEPNFWILSGIAARQDRSGGRDYLPYSAVLESICLPFGSPECWRIESLTIDRGAIEIDSGSLPASDAVDGPLPKAVQESKPPGEPEGPTASSGTTPPEPVVPADSGLPEPPPIVDIKEVDDPAPRALSEDALISLIQLALEELGFDPGSPDGKMGPRTKSAIEEYQRNNDLHADGKPTQKLLDHIKKQLKAPE
jgi:hypothetical protein